MPFFFLILEKSGGGGGPKKSNAYNRFMKSELKKLKEEFPDLDHVERSVPPSLALIDGRRALTRYASMPGSRWELPTGTRRRKRERLQSPKIERSLSPSAGVGCIVFLLLSFPLPHSVCTLPSPRYRIFFCLSKDELARCGNPLIRYHARLGSFRHLALIQHKTERSI